MEGTARSLKENNCPLSNLQAASSLSSSALLVISVNAVQKKQSFFVESKMALVEGANEGRQSRCSRRDTSPVPVGKALHRKESVRRIPYYEESIASSQSSRSSIYDALPAKSETALAQQSVPLMSGALTPSKFQNQNLHVPHKLETIIEQKSIVSLRQATSLTLRQKVSVISQLSRKNSINTLRARAKKSRRFSFSVNDLPDFKAIKRIIRQSISSANSSRHSFNVLSTYPAAPVEDPPSREPTPPGLPSFNTPQALNYQLPPPKPRFRDAVRCRLGDEEEQYMKQSVGLPRGVVMRGENGTLVRGTFKPPTSAQTYMPTARSGNVPRDQNGFALPGQIRLPSTNYQLPMRLNDDTGSLTTIPPVIPERISSRGRTEQPPKRRSSLLSCCCNIDEYRKERDTIMQGSADGMSEDEDLEALRAAISGLEPVI